MRRPGADARGDYNQYVAIDRLYRRQRIRGYELEIIGLDLGRSQLVARAREHRA